MTNDIVNFFGGKPEMVKSMDFVVVLSQIEAQAAELSNSASDLDQFGDDEDVRKKFCEAFTALSHTMNEFQNKFECHE